ncbi:MAG: ATP-binding protein [Bacteroidota bacterium]
MSTARFRYPGLRPFSTDEENYFFGRDEEVEAVCRLLDLDNLIVLHGPSGMGKSSLINAGILPALSDLRNWEVSYRVVPIRFSNYDPELARMRRAKQENAEDVDSDLIKDPIMRFIDACLGNNHSWHEVLPLPKPSLWLAAKQMLVDIAIQPMRLVFILDQFEELFTYPEERVEEFASQLGEIFHQSTPASIRKGMERKQIIDADQEAKDRRLPAPKVAQLLGRLAEPLDAKILISMRSDKLHYLERLKTHLPEMMVNSYELRPFNKEHAKKAIVEPAALQGDHFASTQFTINDELLDEIIHFLEDKVTRRIDPSQLQIVCQHIEQKIIAQEQKIKK